MKKIFLILVISSLSIACATNQNNKKNFIFAKSTEGIKCRVRYNDFLLNQLRKNPIFAVKKILGNTSNYILNFFNSRKYKKNIQNELISFANKNKETISLNEDKFKSDRDIPRYFKNIKNKKMRKIISHILKQKNNELFKDIPTYISTENENKIKQINETKKLKVKEYNEFLNELEEKFILKLILENNEKYDLFLENLNALVIEYSYIKDLKFILNTAKNSNSPIIAKIKLLEKLEQDEINE